ncbi:MAG: GAF domain-containing protein [Methanobacteriota archaeon]
MPKKKSGKKAPAPKPMKAIKPKAVTKTAKAPKFSGHFLDAYDRVKAIVAKEAGCEAKMLEICWLLNSKFPSYNWVGFYIATRDRQLVLGPYVGEPTEHTHIPFGSGICGQAAESGKTFVVDDVSQESNYIACSMYVRSEIVVPIMARGEIAGELDIDSHAPRAFSAEDRAFLEKVCESISALF